MKSLITYINEKIKDLPDSIKGLIVFDIDDTILKVDSSKISVYKREPGKKELKKIEQKPAWSEEDEKVLHAIRNALNYEKPRNYLKSRDFEFTDILDWLKSLKERYTWEPSEEQMGALKEACDEHWEPDGLDPLYTLYQDLKKLK